MSATAIEFLRIFLTFAVIYTYVSGISTSWLIGLHRSCVTWHFVRGLFSAVQSITYVSL